MRAWLLLLAVLATFQPYVQVASTEDISRIFITAISPSSIANNSITQRRTPTQALAAAHEPSERLRTVIQARPSATLSKALNPLIDLTAAATNLPPSATSKPRGAAVAITPTLSTSIAASIFLYGNSDSDKNTIYNNRTRYSHNHNHKTNIASTVDNVIIDTNAIDQVYSTEINRRYDALEFHQTSQVQQSSPQLESYIPTTIIDNTVTQKNINRNMEMSAKASNGFHNSDHERLQTKQPVSSSTNASLEANSIDRGIESEADEIETEDTYSSSEIFDVKLKPDPSTLVEIENSLLSLFNMKRPPKIDRSKIVIPEAMKQLYAQIMGHELDSVNIPKPGILTKSANTVRSFTHQDSKIDDRFPHHHRFRLFFDIKSIPGDEKLKAAEVQLTRDTISHAALNPRLANRTRYQVLVYDITRVGVRGKREPSYLLLDNKTIRLNSTDTVSLDVQPAVNRWLASPTKNYGLLVEVRTMRTQKPAPHHHVRLRRSADEPHDVWQHKQPLLFAYTDDGQHKARSIRDVSARSKRAGNGGGHHHRRSHRRKNNDEQCRRHALYVDFADVGWSDWIVAPPGYDAFYCHGKCPFPLAEHLNSTNHAVVQTLVNNINPGKVPKACCVPTQLEGISMLYLNDQNTVVLKNYQEMTVVGCGCR